MKITDPLIEILAIKLYEHDDQSGLWPPKQGWSLTSWMSLDDEDREIFRRIARGENEDIN